MQDQSNIEYDNIGKDCDVEKGVRGKSAHAHTPPRPPLTRTHTHKTFPPDDIASCRTEHASALKYQLTSVKRTESVAGFLVSPTLVKCCRGAGGGWRLAQRGMRWQAHATRGSSRRMLKVTRDTHGGFLGQRGVEDGPAPLSCRAA